MRAICATAALVGLLATCGCGKSPPPAAPSLAAKTVSGEVISPGGRPIVGASVVVNMDWSGENLLRLETDSEGRFSFDLDVPACEAHRLGTLGRASVYASGYGVGGGFLLDRDNVIVLTAAAEFSGTVADALGRPVPDALVELKYVADARGSFIWADVFEAGLTARSERDGQWRIAGVPAGGGVAYVRLTDPRFIRVTCKVPVGGGSAGAGVLVARPGGSIAGRVVYEDGTPSPTATVLAQPRDDSGGEYVFDSRAQTAADGSYLLPGLGRGKYNVMVIKPPDGWVAAAEEAVQIAPPHNTSAHDLVLTRGAVVEGRVTDGRTGAPLPGVKVGGHGPSRPESSAAIFGANADADGRYALRLPPGESYLSAETGRPPLESAAHRVALKPGEIRTVDLVLWPPRKKGSGWWPF